MNLKLLLITILILCYLPCYTQDRVELKNGELQGYITFVNDSILKFKTSKEDKSEFTFKRTEVLSYTYSQPIADTTDYKHCYVIKDNKDTLMHYKIGDTFYYQLMGQCAEPMLAGKILKLRNDRFVILHKRSGFSKPQQNEILLAYICYIAKPNTAKDALKTTLTVGFGIVGGLAASTIESCLKIHPVDSNIKIVTTN